MAQGPVCWSLGQVACSRRAWSSSEVARRTIVRTFSPKATDINRVWYEADADGAVLSRLAAEVARVLRGKHKPIFAPHMDPGEHVVKVNAAKLVQTNDN